MSLRMRMLVRMSVSARRSVSRPRRRVRAARARWGVRRGERRLREDPRRGKSDPPLTCSANSTAPLINTYTSKRFRQNEYTHAGT